MQPTEFFSEKREFFSSFPCIVLSVCMQQPGAVIQNTSFRVSFILSEIPGSAQRPKVGVIDCRIIPYCLK